MLKKAQEEMSMLRREKKDILNPENVALRRLDKDDMWIRPYYGKGNFGHWNYPLGVVMYGLMRTAELLKDKKIYPKTTKTDM